MLRKFLLFCGIFAGLLRIGGDVIAALRYEGYSYTGFSVSELSAIGAPTRSFLSGVLLVDALLIIAFGAGVWLTASGKRGLRVAGGLLLVGGALGLALEIVNMVTPLGSMQTREEMAQTGETANDTLHLAITGLNVLLILLMMAFGSASLGRGWRFFSYAMIVVLPAFGAWSAQDAPLVANNLPTPWLGIKERVSFYSYYVWMIGLAFMLLRAPATMAAGTPPTRLGTPRLTPR